MAGDLYGMANKDEVIDWIRKRGGEPLFLGVTGSHMWGLNRPDSDLDIRGVYLDPLEKVVALHPGRDTIEAVGILGGEVDIQLYELKKAFSMLHNSNGNLVELLLSPTCFFSTPMIDFPDLARRHLSRRLAGYYLGYYNSQRKRAMENRGSKALLYTFREIMAGIWLMRTGDIIYDFHTLRRNFEQNFWPIPCLEGYLAEFHNQQPVPQAEIWEFEREWHKLECLLVEERDRSVLKPEVDHYELLNKILRDARLGPIYWRVALEARCHGEDIKLPELAKWEKDLYKDTVEGVK